MQVTPKVGARRGPGVDASALVAVGCNFGHAEANDRALARPNLVKRRHLARRDVFGKILDRASTAVKPASSTMYFH